MLKGRKWYINLNPVTCWRFFKYKFVLADGLITFERDKILLEYCTQNWEQICRNNGWKFSANIKSVVDNIDSILNELKVLQNTLALLTNMISILCNYG